VVLGETVQGPEVTENTTAKHTLAPATDVSVFGQEAQVDDEAAPATAEKVPAEQFEQPAAPLLEMNVPTGQAKQLAAPPTFDKGTVDHVHCDNWLLPVFKSTLPSAPRTLTLSPAGPPVFWQYSWIKLSPARRTTVLVMAAFQAV